MVCVSAGLSRREMGETQMTQSFQIIDTKTGKVAFARLSEREAHKRVDLLNACGIVRYKARAA